MHEVVLLLCMKNFLLQFFLAEARDASKYVLGAAEDVSYE